MPSKIPIAQAPDSGYCPQVMKPRKIDRIPPNSAATGSGLQFSGENHRPSFGSRLRFDSPELLAPFFLKLNGSSRLMMSGNPIRLTPRV